MNFNVKLFFKKIYLCQTLFKSNHGFTSLFANLGGKWDALSQCVLL